MCSWCFAFAPLLASVRASLKPGVELQLVLGGLARDDDQPMEEATKTTIQEAWRSIEARTATRFNWDYWDECEPRRSTWPACRAVLAAGDRRWEMFAAIQEAYYLKARDPSDLDVLVQIGVELGFDREAFGRSIHAAETQEALEREFERRRELGARAFPSLGVRRSGELRLLTSGWIEERDLQATLSREGLVIEP